MPSLASGSSCCTACASTCAAECRMTLRPSSVSAATGSTSTSASGAQARSRSRPVGVADHDDGARPAGRQARLADRRARGRPGRHPDGGGRGTGCGRGHGEPPEWCATVPSMLEGLRGPRRIAAAPPGRDRERACRSDRMTAQLGRTGRGTVAPGRGASLRARPRAHRLRSTATAALAHSTTLVRRVEELGFRRYWVAEHHGMPGIGSSSPAVLIAHLAAATSRIRVGSGGVMLPNHQPLVVAEQFGTLEALHPGRIDLGIGRAPGTDPRTAAALRRGTGPLGADDFPEQLTELVAYFRGDGPVRGGAGRRARSRRSGCSVPAATAPRSPGCSGCRSRSRTTSAGTTRCPRWRCTGETFRPSAVLDAAVLDDRRRGAGRGHRRARRAGWRCRARCSSCGCDRAGPGWSRPRRRRPPTRTPPRSAPSSRTGWPGR